MGLRIVFITFIAPVARRFVPALQELGHDPVAVIGARRKAGAPTPAIEGVVLGDDTLPKDVDLLLPRDKWSIERLLRAYEPDVALCYGYPWKIPAEALAVPRYGCVNQHPAPLPKLRGPIPFAWTLREGASHFTVTWHRMDAELDTGNILAQGTVPIEDTDTSILEIAPKLDDAAIALLPGVFEQVVAGEPGLPQDHSQATWAGLFEADYAEIDWSQPARSVHDQVRAWNLSFGLGEVVGAVGDVDGERLHVVRTSLTDPGGGERRVECGDGPIWILESEPLD